MLNLWAGLDQVSGTRFHNFCVTKGWLPPQTNIVRTRDTVTDISVFPGHLQKEVRLLDPLMGHLREKKLHEDKDLGTARERTSDLTQAS